MLLSIFLSICVISTSFVDIISITSFELGQSYVKENLCINKEEKQLTCEGKCFLTKMLEKNRSNDSEAPGLKKSNLVSQYFVQSRNSISLAFKPKASIRQSFIYNSLEGSDLETNVFHPPRHTVS
jgi:hypothetical protein